MFQNYVERKTLVPPAAPFRLYPCYSLFKQGTRPLRFVEKD
jgi:hypothetical protein